MKRAWHEARLKPLYCDEPLKRIQGTDEAVTTRFIGEFILNLPGHDPAGAYRGSYDLRSRSTQPDVQLVMNKSP